MSSICALRTNLSLSWRRERVTVSRSESVVIDAIPASINDEDESTFDSQCLREIDWFKVFHLLGEIVVDAVAEEGIVTNTAVVDEQQGRVSLVGSVIRLCGKTAERGMNVSQIFEFDDWQGHSSTAFQVRESLR